MEFIYWVEAGILGIVEGLTEFLPVSSTGHLILAADWLGFDSGVGKVFEVVIQLGAILAVCWLFRERILRLLAGLLRGDRAAVSFTVAVLVAFLPSAVIGVVFIKIIKYWLFRPVIVAITLVLGGLVILWVERRPQRPETELAEEISLRQALVVGLAQVVSMIPGTSRSGATIIGGMLGGMSRSAATDFSFFLAIPTMLGATVLDLVKNGGAMSSTEVIAIAFGFFAAFVSALVVIRFLIHFVAHHTLRVFAWYRIGFGGLMLVWYGLLPAVAG
jgi:undecaprenyl-diphosphatase